MKTSLITLIFMMIYGGIFSQAPFSKYFGISAYFGSTYHSPLDRSLKDPTNLSLIDSRLVFSSGIDLRIFPLSLPKLKIFTSSKIGWYRLNISSPSSTLSDKGLVYKHHLFYTDLGFGIIYNISDISSISFNPTFQQIIRGGSSYRKTRSYGFSIGYERKINKLKVGIEYYQRLYFTGFNREISRVMLRVGF